MVHMRGAHLVHTAHLPKLLHCDVAAKLKSTCFISSTATINSQLMGFEKSRVCID